MKPFVLAATLAASWIAPAEAGPATLEQAVLDRINHARAHPREYAEELREYRSYFEGRLLLLPGDPTGVVTREGPAAVDEAIEFLDRQAPLPPLSMGEVLAAAAQDHAFNQGRAGGTGHVSADGASPGERVRRRGGDIYVGETISYGYDHADEIVRQFIVDDGVPGRGHRKLLFTRSYRFAGVGCGGHRRYGYMCVVDLSDTERGEPRMPGR